ncbi:hypothetical protein ACJX0J_013226, partial [Zea mays]
MHIHYHTLYVSAKKLYEFKHVFVISGANWFTVHNSLHATLGSGHHFETPQGFMVFQQHFLHRKTMYGNMNYLDSIEMELVVHGMVRRLGSNAQCLHHNFALQTPTTLLKNRTHIKAHNRHNITITSYNFFRELIIIKKLRIAYDFLACLLPNVGWIYIVCVYEIFLSHMLWLIIFIILYKTTKRNELKLYSNI